MIDWIFCLICFLGGARIFVLVFLIIKELLWRLLIWNFVNVAGLCSALGDSSASNI